MGVAATIRLDIQFSAGVWSNVTTHTVAAEGMRFRRGMSAGGPHDRIATTGTLEFVLRNDAGAPHGLQGYYSPSHTNVRSGWAFGVPVRVVATYSAVDYPLWRGRVRTINPTAGRYGKQRVYVTAQDVMGDIADSIVREIEPQLNKTEVELLQAIVAALPTDAQPAATSYDTALDAYPYALDNAAGGASAMGLMADVVTSAIGYLYPLNDGTLRYTNRQTWVAETSSGTLGESQMHFDDGLGVPSSRDNVFNRIRVTAHPKDVDEENNTILWSADTIIAIGAGQTQTVWATYFDPGNPQQLIGGADVQFAPVAGTDYIANSDPTGLATDVTSDVDVVVSGFTSTAMIEITNNNANTAYLVNTSGEPALQIKGRGIYDFAPITAESYTAATYADRTLTVDLPYQDDGNIAQGVADFMKSQYLTTNRKAEYVRINPQDSNTVMLHALQREIGDQLTLTETMTGLSSVDVAIVGIEFEVKQPAWLMCRFTLAPTMVQNFFVLDTSTLNGAAVLGYV